MNERVAPGFTSTFTLGFITVVLRTQDADGILTWSPFGRLK
jgi:hypothetical protein